MRERNATPLKDQIAVKREAAMTLKELQRETLVEKHRRLMQAKCRHEEVWRSSVTSERGTWTQVGCFDCGKYWSGKDR